MNTTARDSIAAFETVRKMVGAMFLLACVSWGVSVHAQAPAIFCTSPAQNELNVTVNTNISVTFNVDMDETTINASTFIANARSTGLHQGTIGYDSQTRTATFNPYGDFFVGEVVTVVLTTDILSTGGVPLDDSYVWSFTTAASEGPGIFPSYSIYPVGRNPCSIYAADLDSDGELDLIAANEYDNNVSLLLNNGDGTFAPGSTCPVGDNPGSVLAADLDRDGDIDIITANCGSDDVSVLLNNGDGTFPSDSVYHVSHYPNSIFAADLDGDGHADIVTANGSSHNISVLLNNGHGAFAPPLEYSVDGWPTDVVAADFDGDGDLDLAISDSYPAWCVIVLLNDGDGTFMPGSILPVGQPPTSIHAADFDTDGDLDLAAANLGSGNASVLSNIGDGTFISDSTYWVGDEPMSVFAADLDGDGDIDLAIADYHYCYANVASVLLNNGDGTFAPHSAYSVGGNPYSIFVADFNGDGRLDIATANPAFDNVSILLNHKFICGDANSDSTVNILDITHLIAYLYKGGPAPDPIDAADVDSNGNVNLLDITYLIAYIYKDGPAPVCP